MLFLSASQLISAYSSSLALLRLNTAQHLRDKTEVAVAELQD
jgi:hypothetical protein